MAISSVSPIEALKASRHTLGLPTDTDWLLDDTFLAASLRRTAGFLCPCSPHTLRSSVLESLQNLGTPIEDLSARIGAVIDGLTMIGDLLELNSVTVDGSSAKGTWTFAAPPGFVVRPSGSIFLTGIAPDESTPLPSTLGTRVIHEGFARIIEPEPGEDLQTLLAELGLLRISERTWLKTPKHEPARRLIEDSLRKLQDQPPSGHVNELRILHPESNPRYYAGRWLSPTHESGAFVARRPQAYGPLLWGYVMLENGRCIKLLDLPPTGSRLRGCDVAWHLQMAIDHERGFPQAYRCRSVTGGVCMDFFSPIPLWAERRLAIFGGRSRPEGCLFSYSIPESERSAEELFLEERLWLRRV